MKPLVALLLALAALNAHAVVIRDDVSDERYLVAATQFPALADLPGEGHGVLIAPRWVVTAAHAVTWQSAIPQISLHGKARAVARVVVHPGYRKPPQQLTEQALATWDWTLFRVLLASSDDIALIELKEPVGDVAPVPLHQPGREGDEVGELAQFFGKGATGTGATGYAFSDPHRTQLRRGFNKVTSAHGRWLCYVFDAPADALPLEGCTGSGDSGGPLLIQQDGAWRLAGLASWVDPQSTVRRPGRYGQVSCNVRLQAYRDWMDGVMGAGADPSPPPALPR